MFEGTRRAAKEGLLQLYPGAFWWYVRVRHGLLEPEMALLTRLCRPDRTSVDIGANYGIYSYYMLKHSARCVAFEPYPRLARILRRGLGARLEVHEVALSDRSGIAELRASLVESGLNTIESSNRIETKVRDPNSLETLQVSVRRLDDFDLGRVGFMKIDVEGHEQEVLSGAEDTLLADRPALLIELEERHRPGTRDKVVSLLQDLGYHGFFFRSGRLLPVASFDPSRFQNPDKAEDHIRNFIFLPPERLADVQEELG